MCIEPTNWNPAGHSEAQDPFSQVFSQGLLSMAQGCSCDKHCCPQGHSPYSPASGPVLLGTCEFPSVPWISVQRHINVLAGIKTGAGGRLWTCHFEQSAGWCGSRSSALCGHEEGPFTGSLARGSLVRSEYSQEHPFLFPLSLCELLTRPQLELTVC